MSEEKEWIEKIQKQANEHNAERIDIGSNPDYDGCAWCIITGLLSNYLSLESRLKEAEEIRDIALKEHTKLEERLSQAEAENQVLRDENIAYNKNYLKLMDVAGKMAGALDKIADSTYCKCENGCEKIAKQALASWQDVKEDSRG